MERGEHPWAEKAGGLGRLASISSQEKVIKEQLLLHFWQGREPVEGHVVKQELEEL